MVSKGHASLPSGHVQIRARGEFGMYGVGLLRVGGVRRILYCPPLGMGDVAASFSCHGSWQQLKKRDLFV